MESMWRAAEYADTDSTNATDRPLPGCKCSAVARCRHVKFDRQVGAAYGGFRLELEGYMSDKSLEQQR